MGESRWEKIKRWWVANDPDDLARAEYRLAAERLELVGSAERLTSTAVVDQQREAAERYQRRRHLA